MFSNFGSVEKKKLKDWSFGGASTGSLLSYLNERQLQDPTRFPMTMREKEVTVPEYNKIFTSVWINANEVVMGSKCNKLIVLNFKLNTKREILLPKTLAARAAGEIADNNGTNNPQDAFQCIGIHCLAVNPSRTMLAVGAGSPIEVMLFQLPSFEPVPLKLTGHTDMVFALAWVNDDILLSGSRDSTVRLWSADLAVPVLTSKEHKNKVRDLKYNSVTKKMLTLSAEGSVKIWDCQKFMPYLTVPLNHKTETVTVGMNDRQNLYCVGSLEHICVIDPRMEGVVHEFSSLDENWGVRALTFHENVITIGGGMGRIGFYDIRARKHIPVVSSEKPYFQTCKGWLHPNSTFSGIPMYNAVYTLSYDHSKTRLFAAGGPLQLNLCGSFAALYS